MSKKPQSVKLSSIDVELKKDGNIELVYSHITADEFKNTMDSKLPEYENTELLYSFIKRLENITKVYRETINKLL
jgi:hypothetical protein|tara:strand:+ start:253 stop:477 length:225 start_codon:yes stop_codon:yes gene_type:complete